MLCRRCLLRLKVTPRSIHHPSTPCATLQFPPFTHPGRRTVSVASSELDRWGPTRKRSITSSDTIYALSSAPGRAAIAVIRISGSACLDVYHGLCPNRPLPHSRTATLRRLYDPHSPEPTSRRILDSGALVLYFPAPNTVTGEDILELHVHGGPAIVRSVLEAIPRCPSSRLGGSNHVNVIRPAEAGEFTKRAFYNGRLDLTQAEALGDTLAAETEQQRRLAISGSANGLAERYERWRAMLLHARGELEALIDFSEDQHFDESPLEFMESVSDQVRALKRQIELHVQNASKGEMLRHGISIALLGAPNAGKSSLLNQIVGREAAIVSAEEGTTRDIVDVTVDIGGWLCRLGDMAGLRRGPSAGAAGAAVGSVEREGIRRARERALQSDVVVALLSIDVHDDGTCGVPINTEVLDAVGECQAAGKAILIAVNKADLLQPSAGERRLPALQRVCDSFPSVPRERIFVLSCKDADTSTATTHPDPGGIQSFLAGLTRTFGEITAASTADDAALPPIPQAQSYWSASLAITHRQSQYLQQCLRHLDDFLAQSSPMGLESGSVVDTDHHEDMIGIARHSKSPLEREVDIVTAAEHLRFAAVCLGKITGRGEGGDVEDVLGVVFEK